MAVTVEYLSIHADARGFVFEPLQVPALGQQQNVHTVVTLPGHVRGNHRHRKATEVLITQGPALVRYRENGQVQEKRVGKDEVLRFTFPPGVGHAVQNTGSQPQVLVAFSSLPHDPEHPDTERDVLIPANG